MSTTEVLARLEMVRPCGKNRWIARCPAHPDRHPSLAVTEGKRGILIRCWAGCRLEEIVDALDLSISELFFNNPETSRDFMKSKLQRSVERERKELRELVRGLVIDDRREAERLLDVAKNLDISRWNDEDLHKALNAIADAYDVLYAEKVECGSYPF